MKNIEFLSLEKKNDTSIKLLYILDRSWPDSVSKEIQKNNPKNAIVPTIHH